MKKYMIIVVSFAVLAAGLTLGVRTYNRSNENRLLMANIDALTNPENGGGGGTGENGNGGCRTSSNTTHNRIDCGGILRDTGITTIYWCDSGTQNSCKTGVDTQSYNCDGVLTYSGNNVKMRDC